MNFKKVLFLFLALLLPIVVFLFLKGFGKNEFAVEPLFQNEVVKPVGCSGEFSIPYRIVDSTLMKLNWSAKDSLTLLIFNREEDKKILAQESRLHDELPEGIRLITNPQVAEENCVFLLRGDVNAVFIDSKRRIRGQYDLRDLDEADRLIMEANIILKKY